MSLKTSEIDALIDAVRQAGRDEILPRFRNLAGADVATKTGPDDLVTAADLGAERSITAAARRILPSALVVGEEAVETCPSLLDDLETAELAVIIDPVDGTGNFAAGLSLFGTILAVVSRGETVFGLLYDPVFDDWVAAEKGSGVFYLRTQHEPVSLRSSRAIALEDARGFLSLNLYPAGQRPVAAALLPRFRMTRSLRCSCHEYRQLVLGHAEFIVTPAVKPWDHAAGAMILEEAGGAVIVAKSDRYGCRTRHGPMVCATSKALASDLARELDMSGLWSALPTFS